MQTDQVAKVKILVNAKPARVEQYVMDIDLPIKVWNNSDSINTHIELPHIVFSNGVLSKSSFVTFVGRITRATGKFAIKFCLPEKIGTGKLSIKPFRVDGLHEGNVKWSFIKEFPQVNSSVGSNQDGSIEVVYYHYSMDLELASYLKIGYYDIIRFTWNILVEEAPTCTVESADKDEETLDTTDGLLTSMKSALKTFHNSENLSDVIIECGKKEIPVHRLALALASPVFRKMFESDMKEKKDGRVLIDMDLQIFQLMLEGIYTGKLEPNINLDELMSLFKACHQYDIESLKNQIKVRIYKSVSTTSALEVYALGVTYNEEKLKKKALGIIKNEKKTVFESEKRCLDFLKNYPKLMVELKIE